MSPIRTPVLLLLGLLPAAEAAVAQVPARLGSAPLEDRIPGNFLVLVADDVGVDRIGAYGEHPDAGNTPRIDQLAREGILFRNAWSNPSCSPTRATLLTGRYSFRTGIGKPVPASAQVSAFQGLRLSETTIPEMLGPRYTSVALGKWHLGTGANGNHHPTDSGFHAYAGSQRNLFGDADIGIGDVPFDYFRWEKTVDGSVSVTRTYATTDTVNDAVAAIARLPEPWFLYVAFNASHKPLHAPPDELHSFDLTGQPFATPIPHMKAMTEAMDTEIGRLLDRVDMGDTTVFFIGDNGTGGFAIDPPFDPTQGKGSLYESGINVPFIVAGRKVSGAGSECAALVNTTDLFATLGELAGMPAETGVDSVSLVPYLADPDAPSRRKYVYAEKFSPNGFGPYQSYTQAVRGPRYKLIWRPLSYGPQFYDLHEDPYEQHDLMQLRRTGPQLRAFAELKEALGRLTGS